MPILIHGATLERGMDDTAEAICNNAVCHNRTAPQGVAPQVRRCRGRLAAAFSMSCAARVAATHFG
ncbi:MAG: hypothetical protein KDI74_12930, partial [Gammaproteobacteria bacterium]|nr:hypothetical protein [Gammaproteobacteria bacterium]